MEFAQPVIAPTTSHTTPLMVDTEDPSPIRIRRASLNDGGDRRDMRRPSIVAITRRWERWKSRRSPLGKHLRAVLFALVLSLSGSLHMGYALGTGPAVAAQLFPSTIPGATRALSTLVLTCVYLGAALGSLLGGALAQKYGRRVALLTACPLGVVGWVGWSVAREGGWGGIPVAAQLITARCLVGISGGISSAILPVYIAEVSPTRMRGALICLHQVGIGAGFTLAYVIGWAAVDAAGVERASSCWGCGWRLAGWLGVVPLGVALLAVFCLPESPRWAAYCGDVNGARSGLTALRGSHQPTLLEAELAAILAAAQTQQTPRQINWRRTSMPTRLAVGVLLALTTQLAGGFDSFVTPMETAKLSAGLETLGLGNLSERALTLLLCAGALVCMLLGAVLCEAIGRRRLVLLGGMLATLAPVRLPATATATTSQSATASQSGLGRSR
jgi:MFS family permease